MNRKRIWGWWFFDWASQPYATLLLTFIFSIYFSEVARGHFIAQGADPMQAGAQAQALWGWALVTVIVFMVTSLGAAPADRPDAGAFIKLYGPLIVIATIVMLVPVFWPF